MKNELKNALFETFIYELCYTSIQKFDNYAFDDIAFFDAIDERLCVEKEVNKNILKRALRDLRSNHPLPFGEPFLFSLF